MIRYSVSLLTLAPEKVGITLFNQAQAPLEDVILVLFKYLCLRAQSSAKAPFTNRGTSAENVPKKKDVVSKEV